MTVLGGVGRGITAILIAPIRLYQRVISPMRPPTCRFHPSCSAYAVTALEVHGPFVGLWLAIRRLGRCHPWTPGGVDHVPPRGAWRTIRPPYDPSETSDPSDGQVDPRAADPRGEPSLLTPGPEAAPAAPATASDPGPSTGTAPHPHQGA
jgi:putative membrane protein insertion efficiency factor